MPDPTRLPDAVRVAIAKAAVNGVAVASAVDTDPTSRRRIARMDAMRGVHSQARTGSIPGATGPETVNLRRGLERSMCSSKFV